MPPSRRTEAGGAGRIVSILLVAALTLAGCLNTAEPDANRQARDAAELAAVLPLIEDLGLTSYRNQDWCRNIAYSGGRFSDNLEDETCRLFGLPRRPFTPEAQDALRRVESALAETSVDVYSVSVWKPDDAAPNGRTEFDVVGGVFDRWRYVHAPGYRGLTNWPNEWVETAIDDDWYFVWEDWN
jgi:hypothetical protein